jgi:hypothetical protein
MRILIANHIDPAIRQRSDLRAWTQRVFWFARDGDLVILSDEPDRRFLAEVTSLTRVDPQALTVVVAPPGRYAGRLLDPAVLTDDFVLSAVGRAMETEAVEEIFALWPSASVARFATRLGLADRYPGAALFAQNGGELCNSKAVFRALAAGAGISTTAGTVCHSPRDAAEAMLALLPHASGVVVKQAHNGAGVGNELVLTDPASASDHVGARHLHHLAGPTAAAVEAYWAQRWDWASAGGRFPVVVEQFVPSAVSVYAEFLVTNDGVDPTEMGSLHYVGRRLDHQIVPLHDVTERVRAQLAAGGRVLAEAYRAISYRGYVSADAIVTTDGKVLFTEVNAQVTGSLHIYRSIAHEIVGIDREPRRRVVEHHTPPAWSVPDADAFRTALDELGCAYDPATRTGVIPSMPITATGGEPAQFLFCVAYGDDAVCQDILERLDQRFSTVTRRSVTRLSDAVPTTRGVIPVGT